eukprot:3520578-Rhodomonas_salina.1
MTSRVGSWASPMRGHSPARFWSFLRFLILMASVLAPSWSNSTSQTSMAVISSTRRVHNAPTATMVASRSRRRVRLGKRRTRRRWDSVEAGASLRGTPQRRSNASMKRFTPLLVNGNASPYARCRSMAA